MLTHLIRASTGPTSTLTCPKLTSEHGSGLFGPIAKPIADVLAAFYHVFPSYGVTILLLSVAWMLIISPLTLKSTRSMLAMQKIQPEIKKLQDQYKNDRQAFAQAQMDLFRERGVSPFGSCLPTLLPLPIFFALYQVIRGLADTHKVGPKGSQITCPDPKYLSPHTKMFKDIVAGGGHLHSFGLNLAQNALAGHSSFLAALPFFVLLLIMGGTQYLQTAQMMARNPQAAQNPQMKMMKYLPIVFTLICIRFPAGVVLYYSMSNICRIAQQSLMYRYDPKVRELARKDVIDVEGYAHEHEEEHKQERRSGGGRGGRNGGSGGGGGGGGNRNGGGSASAKKPPEDAKPAKSRFGALFEAAKEEQTRKQEARTQARGKDQPRDAASSDTRSGSGNRSGSGGGRNGRNGQSGGNGQGGSSRHGGNRAKGKANAGSGSGGGANANRRSSGASAAAAASKPGAKAPANGGGANGGSNGGGSNGGAKPNLAKTGNGNGGGNGTKNGGGSGPKPASRTGAGRAGGNKKRRGR